MVLESTIVCVDNSEFSRNGDFPPSRFAAQVDSVNMLCSAKVQAHAESSVGLMTLAGRNATILVTSTRDLGRIFTCLHDVKFDGLADFVGGIQKAQLALKHRQNTLQRQRIVVFVSSPITTETEALVKLAKNLKKNNVSVDVINIGLEGENVTKIDAFVAAVNSNDSSRALHVASGSQNLADALMHSDIYIDRDGAASGLAGDGSGAGAGAGATGGDGGEFPYGVDPSVDPELAMVLRISMEEERARQAAAREAEGNAAATAAASTESNKVEGSGGSGSASGSGGDSKGADAVATAAAAAAANYDDNDEDLYGTGGDGMDVDGEEAEMLRRAIELSKQDAEQGAGSEKKDGGK